jgi:hypothetical protein
LSLASHLDCRAATAIRVRVADGPPQRIKDKGHQHPPGAEAWLVGESLELLAEFTHELDDAG